MKKCSQCKIDKELGDFYKSSRDRDGYRGNCKECNSKYRKDNKERLTEYFKNRKYDPEKKKEYYELNKDHIKSRSDIYYQNNKEKKLEYQKEYQKNNKDKRNLYLSERRKNDPLFKLITNVRNLINNSFYGMGYSKESRTQEILGCSFEELKSHLESKFESWMSWENRGLYNGYFDFGWDIDHITSLSSAKSIDELIKLNHYTNLQPLCSKINREIKREFNIVE